jgi:hypothetical protein
LKRRLQAEATTTANPEAGGSSSKKIKLETVTGSEVKLEPGSLPKSEPSTGGVQVKEENNSGGASESGKKKKKKKKNKKKLEGVVEEQKTSASSAGSGATASAKKKRRKNKNKIGANGEGSAVKVSAAQALAKFFVKGDAKKSGVEARNGQQTKAEERVNQYTNERLKAYGINPNQYNRMIKKQKYKQKT